MPQAVSLSPPECDVADGMKFPRGVNRHNAVTASQQRMRNVWPSLVPHE